MLPDMWASLTGWQVGCRLYKGNSADQVDIEELFRIPLTYYSSSFPPLVAVHLPSHLSVPRSSTFLYLLSPCLLLLPEFHLILYRILLSVLIESELE
jgi:hypothetical protein